MRNLVAQLLYAALFYGPWEKRQGHYQAACDLSLIIGEE